MAEMRVLVTGIDGYIGARNVGVGTFVSPGQSLLDVVPKSNLYITANFKETQLGNMKVGQDVDFTVDAANLHSPNVLVTARWLDDYGQAMSEADRAD